MSNTLSGDIRRRDFGIGYSPKAVLLFLADLASDDGSGIFASKVTIAAQLEASRSTIIRAIGDLQKAGLLVEIGTRPRGIIEYQIRVERVHSVPPIVRPMQTIVKRPVAESDTLPQDVEAKTQDVVCSGERHVSRSATPSVAESDTKCSGARHKPKLTPNNLARADAVARFGERAVKAAEFWADAVKDRAKFVPSSALSVQAVDAMIAMKLVTGDQARAKGLAFTRTDIEQRGQGDDRNG